MIDRLPQLDTRAAYFKQALRNKLLEHCEHIRKRGKDQPDITGWRSGAESEGGASSSTSVDNVYRNREIGAERDRT